MNPDEFKKRCRGIVPVQYCPYSKEGELDLDGLKKNTEFLVDFAKNGERDVVILTNGSTTEFYANSIDEQKSVIRTVIDTVDGAVPVVAGSAQAGTRETIKMTKYAERAGADCAMVVLPYYHAPTEEGMYRHYKEIADSVNIGIMIYNNPNVSGSLISPDLMQRLSRIDNIVALKDNSPNAADYAMEAALIDPEDMVLLNGNGELHYVGSAACGGRYKGFVTFFGNFAPSTSYDIYESMTEGDFQKAMEAFGKQLPIWRLLAKFMKKRETTSIIPSVFRTNLMYMSVGKACMDLVGLNGGPLRLPMENLTDEEKRELEAVLKSVGMI